MDYFWAVLLQIFLITLNAIFASAEIAVISMNEAKRNILAAKGGKNAKKAKRLAKLTADPAKFLSTIQVAITLAGFLGSAFAADIFAEPLVDLIMSTGLEVAHSVVSAGCVIIITLVLAFFNIVFGELVPKRIAMKNSEKVACGLSGTLCFVSVVFKPVVWLLTVTTNGMLRLFGISPEDATEEVTEEDILMMAEAGSENGSIESEENEMIKNIFEFNDLTVGEVCTHRKDTDMLFADESEEQWEQTIYSTNHTYYPICGETVDDIIGVLYTKAYFRLKDKTRENVMKNAVQTPVFLYENVPANIVFNKMKTTHEYFAIVVDEYGGIAGIVTIHDLLEAIVGDMDDKGEEADYTIEQIAENEWEITGLAPLGKVEDALNISLEEENGTTYETFSGYIGGIIVSVPQDGTQFEVSTDRLQIKVLTVEKQCIVKVRVSKILTEEEKEDEE